MRAYEILGLEVGATPDEVRSAYRTLAKMYHPDHSKDPSTAELFNPLPQAYLDAFKDAEARASKQAETRSELEVVVGRPLHLRPPFDINRFFREERGKRIYGLRNQ